MNSEKPSVQSILIDHQRDGDYSGTGLGQYCVCMFRLGNDWDQMEVNWADHVIEKLAEHGYFQ